MTRKRLSLIMLSVLLCLTMLLTACGRNSISAGNTASAVKVGIAWRADTDSEFYMNVVLALKEAGAEPVLLDQVVDRDLAYENDRISPKGVAENEYLSEEYAELVKQNLYRNSNVADVMKGIDAVIFTGGEDISPTLLSKPEAWHGIEAEKDYNATRDVSDYILMAYCIDKDIPTMGFCRGMQLMAVVSGGTVIQDIPTFFESNGMVYNYEHRNQKATPDSYRDYAAHTVNIKDQKSVSYDIFGTTEVKKTPSWHHQAVLSVEGTKLNVVGTTLTGGYEVIEIIERSDKSFVVGFQFHPEAAVAKNLNMADNAGSFLDKKTAMKPFEYLVKYVRK